VYERKEKRKEKKGIEIQRERRGREGVEQERCWKGG